MADTFKGIITADGKKRTFAREGITPEYASDKTLSVDGGFADAKVTGDVVKSLKEDLVSLENGTCILKGEFDVGNIKGTTGEYERDYIYQVSNKHPISYDTNLILYIKDGFQVAFSWYDNDGSFIKKDSFIKNRKVITANTKFSVTIFKTGIITGIADIHEYLSAITYEWELINLTNRNDILKNYMKFVYGSLSNGIPISTTASRFRSKDISCAYYDTTFMSLEDRFVLAYHSYDENGNFLYDSGWNYEVSVSKGTKYRLLLKDTMEEYKEGDIESITEKYMVSYNGIESNKHFIDELIDKKTVNHFNDYTVIMAHRGYSSIAPENTMPAFELAYKYGCRCIETDVVYTSDKVPVLCHNININNTARDKDGNVLPETINISTISYEDTKQYDFGIWKNAKYKGTKMCTLEDFLYFCKIRSIQPIVELKTGYDNKWIKEAYNVANKLGMLDKVVWNSFEYSFLTYIHSLCEFTNFFVNVDGDITDDVVNSAISLKTDNNTVYIGSTVNNLTAIGISKALAKNIQVGVGTTDEVSVAKNFCKNGVHFVCTNALLIDDLINFSE